MNPKGRKKNSLLRRLHSDFKWLILLFYTITIAFLNQRQLIPLVVLTTFSLSLVILSEIGIGSYCKKMLIPMSFILGIGIFMPVLYREALIVGSYHLTVGWYMFLFLTIKGIGSVSMVMVLFETTELMSLIISLKKVKIPNLMILLMMMIYRYLFMFQREFAITLDAYQIRTGKRRFNYRDFSSILGQMLRKVHVQGENLTDAMLLRGLKQEIHLPLQDKMKWYLWLILIVFALGLHLLLHIH